MASVAGARGDAEERDRQVERSGMYGEYPAIVRAYQELLGDPAARREALKRAVFLVWYSAIMPPQDTGIPPLPDGTVRSVFDALDAAVRAGLYDAELAWMLAWYHSQSPDLFAVYGASDDLMSFIAATPASDWKGATIVADVMALRGQMGNYWVRKANGAREERR